MDCPHGAFTLTETGKDIKNRELDGYSIQWPQRLGAVWTPPYNSYKPFWSVSRSLLVLALNLMDRVNEITTLVVAFTWPCRGLDPGPSQTNTLFVLPTGPIIFAARVRLAGVCSQECFSLLRWCTKACGLISAMSTNICRIVWEVVGDER